MPFDSMPFDPKLVHPDQAPLLPSGELDLPADLAALAEQLADDAVHLATRYPADRGPQVALAAELVESAEQIKRFSRPRKSLLVTATVLGAGLASIAVLGLSIALAWRDDETAPSFPSLAETTIRPPPLEPLPASTVIRVRPSAAATLSVGELSGPELEALLDLLGSEPRSVVSISF
jgi:hypothetical protein